METCACYAYFQKGESELAANYRPISLLSCVGKILERIVYKYIYNHLSKYKLLYSLQSGFLPHHSTTHQLIELYHNVLMAMENNEYTALVFCDFSKAFDRVWHRGLLFKLEKYGLTGNVLLWLKDYLSNRKQCVVVKNEKSSEVSIAAGVPQGSVLGPLLFLVYINDITDNLLSVTRLFADDTALSFSSKNLRETENHINYDLEQLSVWSKNWLMNFNPQKTETMIITNHELSFIPQFLFDNCSIPLVNQHKHLGVTISNDGKWNSHVNETISRVTKYISTLRKLKYVLSRKNLEKLYLVYVRPILEYACEVWDNCNITDVNKIENLQYEAGRIITGLPIFTKKSLIYEELNWLSLEKRRQNRKLFLFYNIVHDNAPNYLKSLLPPIVSDFSNYNLRNRENFQSPAYRLRLTDSSFIPSASNNWNNLPSNIKDSDTLASFKNSVYTKKKIKHKYFLEYGPRKVNQIHCQLRNQASSLNYDLYRVNLTNRMSCDCGAAAENSIHFLLRCPLFHNQRTTMLRELSWYNNITNNTLLNGDPNLDSDQNISLCKSVQKFICKSKRFNI